MLIWVSYLSFSWTYAFSAVKAALRLALASLCFERAWNLMKFGMAIAARMPMIATTIISSISVKPLLNFFMVIPSPFGFRSGFVPNAIICNIHRSQANDLQPLHRVSRAAFHHLTD